MQRTYINIGAARSHAAGSPACLEVCVNKRAYILVLLFALTPQLVELAQNRPIHFEGAPYPRGGCVLALYLNLYDVVLIVRDDCIEELRALNWKQEKRQRV